MKEERWDKKSICGSNKGWKRCVLNAGKRGVSQRSTVSMYAGNLVLELQSDQSDTYFARRRMRRQLCQMPYNLYVAQATSQY